MAVLIAACSPQGDSYEPDPRFRVLSIELLQGLPDDQLEGAIHEHVLHAIGDDWGNAAQIVRTLPPGVQMLYTTQALDGEVHNGGFNQYFSNSHGELAKEALAGLTAIGASEHAKLLGEAIEIRKREEPTMRQFEEKGTVEAFGESYEHTALNELDDRFYALNEDLSSLRIAFIRANPDLFVTR
jgi:hypothetical protein